MNLGYIKENINTKMVGAIVFIVAIATIASYFVGRSSGKRVAEVKCVEETKENASQAIEEKLRAIKKIETTEKRTRELAVKTAIKNTEQRLERKRRRDIYLAEKRITDKACADFLNYRLPDCVRFGLLDETESNTTSEGAGD